MTMTPNPLENTPRIGMGCWAIGGPLWAGETPLGYSGTDDAESLRTIEAAWAAGVRVFDTAAVYGAGHSEELLGQVLGNRAGSVVVSKFGPAFDRDTRQVIRDDTSPAAIRASAEASLSRLRRERIDVLLCHVNRLALEDVPEVFDTLEALKAEDKIASYGWSTDFPERLEAAAGWPGFAAVEYTMNLFFDAPSQHAVAERHGLQQLIRSPLAMGLLTGKFEAGESVANDDIRANTFDWLDYFKEGRVSDAMVARLDAVRELLTTGGRMPGQGALGWLLARSPRVIPVPGAKTVAQVEENAAALSFGPLPGAVVDEIERLIDRPPEGSPRER